MLNDDVSTGMLQTNEPIPQELLLKTHLMFRYIHVNAPAYSRAPTVIMMIEKEEKEV